MKIRAAVLERFGEPLVVQDVDHDLRRRPLDYFKMFYADTALFGAPHAIASSLEFFGEDRILFASDSPFDPERGPGYIRTTIADLESLALPAETLERIYSGNAQRLLGLDRAAGVGSPPWRAA